MIAKDGSVGQPADTELQKIFLKPFTAPRYIKQYKLPPSYRDVISKKVQKMVEQGLAEPSVSPWNFPALLVPKKGSKSVEDYRMVIDYRKLNDVVEDGKFPIPDINEILDGLGNAKFFSTLDLNQGYYQIGLHEDSRPCTAFSTDDGHWQLTRMPMGLKTSPPVFSRVMRTLLGDLVGKICYVYLDDIVVFASTLEEHEKNLRIVLDRLRDVGLSIKMEKCSFFQTSVSYLGHEISGDSLRPDPAKYETIEKWPVPKNVKETQSFLGLNGIGLTSASGVTGVASGLNGSVESATLVGAGLPGVLSNQVDMFETLYRRFAVRVKFFKELVSSNADR